MEMPRRLELGRCPGSDQFAGANVGVLRILLIGVLVCLEDRKQGEGALGSILLVTVIVLCRVTLARAVYARTKYVLLDDPLSAVVRLFSSRRESELTLVSG